MNPATAGEGRAMSTMRTDTERLDWLEAKYGCGLINDDNGHWALVFDGWQNVPMGDSAVDIASTFFIEANLWRGTIREAIDERIDEATEHADDVLAGSEE